MRYLYKINSAFDGFKPSRIPDRLQDGRLLILGWAKYLDAVRLRDEVWIVFIGRGFENGVYVQGLVESINSAAGEVTLRVRKQSSTCPLSDPATSAALVAAVSVRYRQVFLWPADRQIMMNCKADNCLQRLCLNCDDWGGMPQIEANHFRPPASIRNVTAAPGYWIIPPRCFLYYNGRQPAPWIRRATDMFAAFKVGEKRYAFPFAAGIHAALKERGEDGFEAIVPIPLSPEKADARELDRAATLAAELGRLVGVPSRPLLTLDGPISKRRMLTQGYTKGQFMSRYRQLLRVNPLIADLNRIILLDDVITYGSTLSVAISAIKEVNPAIEIIVAAAGQMVVKDAVMDQNGPAW